MGSLAVSPPHWPSRVPPSTFPCDYLLRLVDERCWSSVTALLGTVPVNDETVVTCLSKIEFAEFPALLKLTARFPLNLPVVDGKPPLHLVVGKGRLKKDIPEQVLWEPQVLELTREEAVEAARGKNLSPVPEGEEEEGATAEPNTQNVEPGASGTTPDKSEDKSQKTSHDKSVDKPQDWAQRIRAKRWRYTEAAKLKASSCVPEATSAAQTEAAEARRRERQGSKKEEILEHIKTWDQYALKEEQVPIDEICKFITWQSVNMADDDGRTPLHLACLYPSIISILLQQFADPLVQDKSGATPLLTAIRMGALDESILKLIVPANTTEAAAAGVHQDNETGELVETSGGNVNMRDSSGETPLQAAVARGREVVVNALVDAGAVAQTG